MLKDITKYCIYDNGKILISEEGLSNMRWFKYTKNDEPFDNGYIQLYGLQSIINGVWNPSPNPEISYKFKKNDIIGIGLTNGGYNICSYNDFISFTMYVEIYFENYDWLEITNFINRDYKIEVILNS